MEADPRRRPRPLTFDEQRAAEAAFLHEEPCADWSEAGRKVYDGLVAVLAGRNCECVTGLEAGAELEFASRM